jgi:hypothetical protein
MQIGLRAGVQRLEVHFQQIVHTFALLIASSPKPARVDFAANSSPAMDKKHVCGLNFRI